MGQIGESKTLSNGAVGTWKLVGGKKVFRIVTSGLVAGSAEAKARMAALRALRGTKSITADQAKRRFAKAYVASAKHPRTGALRFKSTRGVSLARSYDLNHGARRTFAPGAPGSSRYNPYRDDFQGVDVGTKVRKALSAEAVAARNARLARGRATAAANRAPGGLLTKAGFGLQVAGAQQRAGARQQRAGAQQLGGFWW